MKQKSASLKQKIDQNLGRSAFFLMLLSWVALTPAGAQSPAEVQPWRKSLQTSHKTSQTTAGGEVEVLTDVSRVDMALQRQPIEMAISILATAAKKTIILGDEIQSKQVTAFFKNIPVDQALHAFAKAQKLCIVESRDCILLISRQEYLSNYAKTEMVQLKHADPDALFKAIVGQDAARNDLLVTGRPDSRTHTLILKGDPEQIADVREACLSLDRSMTSEVFAIRYASVVTVAKEITDALRNGNGTGGGLTSGGGGATGTPGASGAAGTSGGIAVGCVVPDERSNKLIVHETPENIEFCRNIIQSLDVAVETRVFATGNIDPKTIADQIKKGELGGTEKGDKGVKSTLTADATVQVVEGTNQIIVTDTPERLTILDKIMREMNSNIATLVIQPKNSTPEQLATVLKSAYPNIMVTTDPRSGSLIITGHRERVEEVEKLIQTIDAEDNIQVEIEAKIMLVSSDKLKEYGMRIYGQDLDGLTETFANVSVNPNFPADSPKAIGQVLGNPPNGVLPKPIKSSGNYLEVLQPNIQVQAVVKALERDGDTKMLANPRVRTLNGISSTFFSGSKEPYKTTTLQNTQSIENVQYEQVGVNFTVTPYVSPSQSIMLTVTTDFSTLREIRDGIPVIDTRKTESTVQANSKETILLGGLISEESADQGGGIPLLRSIPGLGLLFGNKHRSLSKKEMLIVITPVILDKTMAAKETLEHAKAGYPIIEREFPKIDPAGPASAKDKPGAGLFDPPTPAKTTLSTASPVVPRP